MQVKKFTQRIAINTTAKKGITKVIALEKAVQAQGVIKEEWWGWGLVPESRWMSMCSRVASTWTDTGLDRRAEATRSSSLVRPPGKGNQEVQRW